jgi:CRP-like cAMP-binding protein
MEQIGIENCLNCIENPKSIFSVLTNDQKEYLKKNMLCHRYDKGETIFKEGTKPTHLVCLSDGKVILHKKGIGGRDHIVRLATPVGFIGYRAMFADEGHRASAVAIEKSITCHIGKTAMFELISQNSQLALNLVRSFATELGLSYSRTITLTQKHIRGRLAESLLFLMDTYGNENDGATIKISMSREDIANLSNMTTSNAIRTLSAFANENIVELNGKKIKILDLSRLEKISEMG